MITHDLAVRKVLALCRLIDYGRFQQQLDFLPSFFLSAVDFAAAYDYLDNFTLLVFTTLSFFISMTDCEELINLIGFKLLLAGSEAEYFSNYLESSICKLIIILHQFEI